MQIDKIAHDFFDIFVDCTLIDPSHISLDRPLVEEIRLSPEESQKLKFKLDSFFLVNLDQDLSQSSCREIIMSIKDTVNSKQKMGA